MTSSRRNAIIALTASGVLWGLTVPLSKLALGWLTPAWLATVRFALAAPVLAVMGRRGLRAAIAPGVILAGAFGFGVVMLLQNAGIQHTSVSHASVIVGVVPMLVALITAGMRQGSTRVHSWLGYGLALGGIALIAGRGGGGATDGGDLLVFGSAAASAAFIAQQPKLLGGRDPAAVTAVQFAAGALVSLPFAASGGLPHAPSHGGVLIVVAALCAAGTVLPFWLFARGQVHVPAEIAGAFVNLEPLVGAAIGWLAFGDVAGIAQLSGAMFVMLGIALSAVGDGAVDRLRTIRDLAVAGARTR